jgi:hypothetical protein
MEQQGAARGFELPSPREAAMEAEITVSTPHPPSLDASLSLDSWGLEADGNPEPIVPLHQIPAPAPWAHEVPSTTPMMLDPTLAAAGSGIPSSTCWPLPSLGSASAVTDGFKSKLSDPVLWPQSTFATTAEGHIAESSPLRSNDPATYPLTPLEPDFTGTLSWTQWSNDEPIGLSEYRRSSMGEYDSGDRKRKRLLSPSNTEDAAGKRKTRRASIQTQHLDHTIPRYVPRPIVRRDSAISLATSATSPTFDTHPGNAIPAIPPSPPDEPPKPKPPPTKQRTPATTTSAKKSAAQARNRAAASRYRAKTAAAYAHLEAEERDASERHQALLACVGRLRDEVFRLKNELLRHADCGCPLVRGYLSRAAEEAWVGLGAIE